MSKSAIFSNDVQSNELVKGNIFILYIDTEIILVSFRF